MANPGGHTPGNCGRGVGQTQWCDPVDTTQPSTSGGATQSTGGAGVTYVPVLAEFTSSSACRIDGSIDGKAAQLSWSGGFVNSLTRDRSFGFNLSQASGKDNLTFPSSSYKIEAFDYQGQPLAPALVSGSRIDLPVGTKTYRLSAVARIDGPGRIRDTDQVSLRVFNSNLGVEKTATQALKADCQISEFGRLDSDFSCASVDKTQANLAWKGSFTSELASDTPFDLRVSNKTVSGDALLFDRLVLKVRKSGETQLSDVYVQRSRSAANPNTWSATLPAGNVAYTIGLDAEINGSGRFRKQDVIGLSLTGAYLGDRVVEKNC